MDSFSLGGVFLEAIGAVTAAGLAAPAAAQVVGLGKDDVGAVVVELAGLGDRGDAVFGIWSGRSHGVIVADGRYGETRFFDRAPFGHFAEEDEVN